MIREGEKGDKFYVVMEGHLQAYKTFEDREVVVMDYKEGDYFGELALIHHEPRQASVKALSKSKLAYVTREGFKRVFGPLQEALMLKSSKYHG